MVDKIMYKKTTFIKTNLPDWFSKKSKVFHDWDLSFVWNIMTQYKGIATNGSYHYISFSDDGTARINFHDDSLSNEDDYCGVPSMYKAPDSAIAVYRFKQGSDTTTLLAFGNPNFEDWNYVLIAAQDKSNDSDGYLISEPFKVQSEETNSIKNIRAVFANDIQNPSLKKKDIYTSSGSFHSDYKDCLQFNNSNQNVKSSGYSIAYWVTFENKNEYPYKDLFKQVNINI